MLDPGMINLLLIYCLVMILGGLVFWFVGNLIVALSGEEERRRRR